MSEEAASKARAKVQSQDGAGTRDASYSGGSAGVGRDFNDGSRGDETAPNINTNRARQGRGAGGQPGAATDRQEWLQEAEQVIIQGDLVGGDKYIISFGKKEHSTRMSRVSPLVLEPSRHAFVAPQEGWDELKANFITRHASLMQSAAGSGRTTLAIRLLENAGHGPVYMVDPDVSLPQLRDAISDDQVRGAGLILLEPNAMSAVTGRELLNLDYVLIQAKTRLIIITGSETRLGDEEALDFRLPSFIPPRHRAIVESHLRWRVGKQADRLFLQDGLSEAVDELLSPKLPCRQAGNLADVIQHAMKDGKVDLGLVARMMARRDANKFTIWIDGFTDREDLCFAVALAVLDGLPYETIIEAARLLYEKIRSRSIGRRMSKVRVTPAGRLEDFRVHMREVYSHGPYGRSVVQAIEYEDRTYPRLVIEHFWQRSDSGTAMVAWLLDIATKEEQPERVRIRAATALGLLAVRNFEYLHDHMFEPWAGDENYLRRDAVANALRVPAANHLTASNVVRLVEKWHGLQRQRTKQATAARGYGISLASSDPIWLIDRLGRLAAGGDVDVMFAVSSSLCDLAVRDGCELFGTILEKLVEWLPNYRREFTAQLAFLQSTTASLTEVHHGQPELNLELWPTLLVLADRDQTTRSMLCILWANVLRSWNSEDATAALTEWAVMAERAPGMRKAFAYLLGAISLYDERARQTVRLLTRQWSNVDYLHPLVATAAVVEDYLGQLDYHKTISE